MVAFLAGLCFGIAAGCATTAFILERACRRDVQAAWDAVDYERRRRAEERGEPSVYTYSPARELARAIDEFNRRNV